METVSQDPVVWAAGGVIALGLFLLVWTLRSLLKSSAPKVVPLSLDDVPAAFPDLPPTPADLPFVSAANEPEPVNKVMAEKLSLMTQRLADMQVQLNRQTAALSAASSAALPPEALDKMILVVNTVIHQVDSLQKSLEGASPNPVSAPTPASPAPSVTPVANPAPVQARPVSSAAVLTATAPPTPTVPVSEIISKQNPSA